MFRCTNRAAAASRYVSTAAGRRMLGTCCPANDSPAPAPPSSCQIITAERNAQAARKLAEEAHAAQEGLEKQLAEQQAAAAALQVRWQRLRGGPRWHVGSRHASLLPGRSAAWTVS